MADDYAITVEQLQKWNSWIGSACDTGLYADLSYDDERAVCIAVNASAPTSTASAGPNPVSSTASMGPTQTGIVAGCSQYHTVQSGDSCAMIDAMYDITFQSFYAWNPAGKTSLSTPLRATHKLTMCNSQWAMIAKISGSATHTVFPVPRPLLLPQSLRQRRLHLCATAPRQGALGITPLRAATHARRSRISLASLSLNCTSGTRTLAVIVRACGSAIRCAWLADHPKNNVPVAQRNLVMESLSGTRGSPRRAFTC
jgi:LysM repeat protein